ncbi:MAG TPA: ribosomal-processing cysteine protease Prp [Candidatus Wallbacteria bacterium]|nr:ribosomal-processing cysteine protease Prp [Candidatus Wallbacteria bacterium]
MTGVPLINVLLTYDTFGRLKHFEVTGHDGSQTAGSNIVCASVSILALTFAKSLLELLEIPMSGTIEKGCISLSLIGNSPVRAEDLNLLLKSFKLGISSIIKEYGNVIDIKEKTLN